MGILFGAERRSGNGQTFPEPVIPPYPGANIYGQTSVTANPDQALMVPTVWACTSLLANSVSMMPLETFRQNPDGVPSKVTNPALLSEPSAGMTQSEWLHQVMVSLLLRGNCFGHIVGRDGAGRPTMIDLLNPDKITVTVDEAGQSVYKLNGTVIPTANVWHVRGMTIPGAKVGLSPIGFAAAQLGLDISARRFASDFLDGGGIPKAVLQTPKVLDQEQARTVKERLMTAVRNREPIVLGEDLKYTQIQVHPEESQFLATMQFNVAQIAKFFGIPAEMVGGSSGNSMTYSNVEQRSLDFLTYAVSFWLRRIEDAVFPLLPRPQYAKFNTDVLLRTDAETQAKVDVQQIAAKIVAPSEVRQRLSMPPMTADQKAEADMVPLTVTPLGGAKALPGLKAPPGAVAPVPKSDDEENQDAGV